jgi:hypothetical protein
MRMSSGLLIKRAEVSRRPAIINQLNPGRSQGPKYFYSLTGSFIPFATGQQREGQDNHSGQDDGAGHFICPPGTSFNLNALRKK